ncbi:MAG: hypothetical protein K6E85_09205 [Lachnospiraceae bacterium]|nr:hypothetical protein [Lachnospiraceae bacterium]
MNNKKSVWERLKAYKLDTQMIIAGIIFLIIILSVLLYTNSSIRSNQVAANLLMALFTSFLVSEFTILVDVTVKYIQHKNEQYLEDLREFGIGNLHRDKEKVLREHIDECDRLIWISGYRLILTRRLEKDIYDAIKRGANFQALICPPWSEAFKMVYGNNEKVIDNYLSIFKLVDKARREMNKDERNVRVVFVNKPIFSDTYRMDQRIVTGPYMHNKDEKFRRLMAKDFFSYEIVRQSDLSKLIGDEYRTLFSEAETMLDWDQFEKVYDSIMNEDFREIDKINEFQKACVARIEKTEDERKPMD